MQDQPAVVITRPLVQSVALAQRVRALGRQAVVFPLLEIHPLVNAVPLQMTLAGLTDYVLVAFVSPNAIDAAFAHLSGWPEGVALAVMGEGSRAALARHGVTDANAVIYSPRDPARTDSETLFAALDIDALRQASAAAGHLDGAKILIVRGESGRELLAERLSGLGMAVTQIAAYRRCAPELTDALRQQLQGLLAEKNHWIVTSSEALRNLFRMAGEVGGATGVAKMQQQRIIVPHARIAETAYSEGFSDVLLTGSGDECLLDALQSTA